MQVIPRATFRKPGMGAQIDYAHPLARGLALCPLLNEGAGATSLREPVTQQAFTVASPYLVWDTMQRDRRYPWSGACLKQDGTNGPKTTLSVTKVPMFQVVPSAFTVAVLFSPWSTGVQAARRLGDTDWPDGFGFYANITSQGASKWGTTFRDTVNTSNLKFFSYTLGDWIFAVKCVRQGQCDIYESGNLVGSYTSPVADMTNTCTRAGHTTTQFYMTEDNGAPAGAMDCYLGGYWAWNNRFLGAGDVEWLYNEPWAMFAPPAVRRFYSLPVIAAVGGNWVTIRNPHAGAMGMLR
jgi:hypothetical protein